MTDQKTGDHKTSEKSAEQKYFSRAGKSHNLSMGIVGLPNVGKSTLFNALTNLQVPAENYPFCTINPSEGRILINDPRINTLSQIYKPKNTVPANLQITDIAGLIKGASEGLGLGNAFLDHIRRVDGIFHVVRCFKNDEVVHCEDSIDPIRDIKIINDELRFKDREIINKLLGKINLRGSDAKQQEFQKNVLEKIINILEKAWVKEHVEDFNFDEIKFINSLNLLTTKNVVYLCNISEEDYVKKKVSKELASLRGIGEIIPFSAQFEYTLSQMQEEGQTQHNSVFVDKLVKAGYKNLNLINYFTAGADEVKSWTIRRETKIPHAGSVIHSDFENYFVMAEVFNFKDLMQFGSEVEVRKNGKYCQRGKNYIVEDGDIIYFKSNPPKSGKKK